MLPCKCGRRKWRVRDMVCLLAVGSPDEAELMARCMPCNATCERLRRQHVRGATVAVLASGADDKESGGGDAQGPGGGGAP